MHVLKTPPYYLDLATDLGRAYRATAPAIQAVADEFSHHTDPWNRTLIIVEHCTFCATSQKYNEVFGLKSTVLVTPLLASHYDEKYGIAALDCLPPPVGNSPTRQAAATIGEFCDRFRALIEKALAIEPVNA